MIDYCLHAVGARLAVPLPVPAQDGVRLGGKCNSRRFECLGGRSKQTANGAGQLMNIQWLPNVSP